MILHLKEGVQPELLKDIIVKDAIKIYFKN